MADRSTHAITTRCCAGALWADRAVASGFATRAVEYDLSTTDELASIAEAWRAWADSDDGLIVLVHGDVLARR